MKHMKKAALLSLLITSFVSARDPECRTMQMNLGPTVNYARYKYDCTPEMSGALVGLHFDWQHSKKEREFVLVRFDGRWSAGKVKGCTTEDKIQDYRPEFNFGWNFNPCWCERKMTFTPFFGLGFIYLSNDLSVHESSSTCNPVCTSSTTCSPSNDNSMDYYNLFVPIGFESNWKYSDCFDIGLRAEYRIDAWTRLRANRDCTSVCDSVKPESRTQGVLVEIPLRWDLGSWCETDWQIKLVPLFDWNRFGAANCKCASTCSDTCETTPCPEVCIPVLTALANCDPATACPLPRLQQFYAGAHLDIGFRF